MPYMLAPGARLYVGPHGQMEESLGACCSSCATSGGSCATGLGATKVLANRPGANAAVLAAGLPVSSAMSAIGGGGHRGLLIGAGAGVLALGVLYLVKRRKAKR